MNPVPSSRAPPFSPGVRQPLVDRPLTAQLSEDPWPITPPGPGSADEEPHVLKRFHAPPASAVPDGSETASSDVGPHDDTDAPVITTVFHRARMTRAEAYARIAQVRWSRAAAAALAARGHHQHPLPATRAPRIGVAHTQRVGVASVADAGKVNPPVEPPQRRRAALESILRASAALATSRASARPPQRCESHGPSNSRSNQQQHHP